MKGIRGSASSPTHPKTGETVYTCDTCGKGITIYTPALRDSYKHVTCGGNYRAP